MSRPNILLIVLDAVRPDHLSCYGYRRNTSPTIDRLAETGARFTNAFSASNWTGAAHGALFTGKPPSVSKVYGNHLELPRTEPTLTERLQDAGYTTFGTSAGAHIRSDRGYDRGFDEFHRTHELTARYGVIPSFAADKQASLEQIALYATRGGDLKTHYKFKALQNAFERAEAPFFGFINAKTAHGPYRTTPEPYLSKYTEDTIRPNNVLLDALTRFFGNKPSSIDGVDRDTLDHIVSNKPVVSGELEPTEEQWNVVKAWYDSAIRYMDEKIGSLVSFLKERGELENTWLLITSDHGELFGEHGLEKHIFSLYEPVLRIPMVIHGPDVEKTVNDSICTFTDLHATIRSFAELSVSDDGYSRPLVPADRQIGHEYVFAEVGRKDPEYVKKNHPNFEKLRVNGPLQAVRDDTYKLIRYPDSSVELFDWRTDPEEQSDLSAGQPAVVERLTGVIDQRLGRMDNTSHHQDVVRNPEVKQQLEHLGYR